MKISAKGRYALAAMISMAQQYSGGEYITVISIAEHLGISKIYLEQVFSLLKRSGLVHSVKGAQGGYQLARTPRQITALEILSAVETALFEKTEPTVPEKAAEIEKVMQLSVFERLDQSVQEVLGSITLENLLEETAKYQEQQAMMFYI